MKGPVLFTIDSNQYIAPGTWKMILHSDHDVKHECGQFVNIKIPGCFLRRPVSVCDADDRHITLIYKTVGKGTEIMSNMTKGEQLDILPSLGKGFDVRQSTENPVLIGGGVGLPPLFMLAKTLIKNNIHPKLIMGFNTSSEVFFEDEFSELLGKQNIIVTTSDGSRGKKGLVTDALTDDLGNYIFACGPVPMLKALCSKSIDGQFSFEERMGCGFGGCMGCTHKTVTGLKKICTEGPVLHKSEIVW